ncbi:hypothetical protein WMF39_18095 [Sorangium sp. So ce1504]|uniref:hypothetical protein n=1 Tax=Sorangium sp. So ce1504 TaxID=3133337 RepID=UPI003F614346
MSLFSKVVLPLTLLGAAAVLGGCVGAAPLEGDDEQETQPESAESIDPDAAEAVGNAPQAYETYTKWTCRRDERGLPYAGTVTIWWGHRSADAAWACNQWVPACRSICYAE